MRLHPPISQFATRRTNRTLHGRSVYHPGDLPGHNVFKGYSRPGTGDAVDLFCGAKTPVYAVADGVVTRWQNDATKKEVVYVEGRGVTTVYAHIDFYQGFRVGGPISEGETVGRVRADLNDPHLHFELWVNGESVSAPDPERLQTEMWTDYFAPEATEHWAAQDMAWAKKQGLIVSSKPDDPATMGHVATVIRRFHDMDREG